MAEGLRVRNQIQTLCQAFNLLLAAPSMAGQFANKQIGFGALRENFYTAMGWDASF